MTSLKIVMARTGVVTGSVRWSTGEPVTDYSVRGYLESPVVTVPKQRITGGGKFVFNAFPSGRGYVYVSTPSGVGASRRVQLEPGGEARAEVVLPKPGCTLSGRVVDEENSPASGVRVDITSRSGGFRFEKQRLPGADGRFTFIVPAGDYRVAARSVERFASRKDMVATDVSVAEGEPPVDVVLTVRKSGWGDLTVEIVDKAGRPLPGVTVKSGGFDVSNGPTGETDVAGTFRIKGIKSGEHYIILTDPRRLRNEHMRLRVPIEAGKPNTHRIVLDAGHRLRGHVVCNGRPVGHVHVMANVKAQNRYSSVHTGKDGAFQFVNLPDGPLTIRGRPYSSNQQVVKTIDIKGDIASVELALPTGRITGKIVDRRGRLVKGCFIKVKQLRAYGHIPKASYVPTSSCDDGQFDLRHLGDGQYRLTVQESQTVSDPADILAVSEPIEIRNGRTVKNIVLREEEK